MNDERRLWEYRWVRDLLGILVVLLLLWLVYSVRAVTLPILFGLVLAYAFDPLVSWAKRKFDLPRWLSTLMLLLIVLVVVASALLYILPGLIDQTGELAGNMPRYFQYLVKHTQEFGKTMGLPVPATAPASTQPAATQEAAAQAVDHGVSALTGLDLSKTASLATEFLGIGLGLVGTTLTATAYLALAAVLVMVCFFNFSWKFDHLTRWFGQFIPPANRKSTLEVIRLMDRAVSAFFRGRMIQAILVGLELTLGWWLVGVPYWLLLGLVGGVLHMIPYGAAAVWPVAVALMWINSATGGAFDPWHVLLWPSIVYFVAQGLDGWVIEPLVQGKATGLDPLSVMLAVLIGGSLAGLLGMMVAVPTAACGKILAQHVVLPRIRQTLGGSHKTRPPP